MQVSDNVLRNAAGSVAGEWHDPSKVAFWGPMVVQGLAERGHAAQASSYAELVRDILAATSDRSLRRSVRARAWGAWSEVKRLV